MGHPAVKKDEHLKKVVAGRVAPEVHAEVVRRAKAERRTMSAFVEIMIERYLKEHPTVQAVPSLDE